MRLTAKIAIALLSLASVGECFTNPAVVVANRNSKVRFSTPSIPVDNDADTVVPAISATSTPGVDAAGGETTASSSELSVKETKAKERKELIRKEGGIFAFNTKYGALNPFGIYYGLMSIFLGIPWFIALNICQLLYFITGNRIDKNRRMPIFCSHCWGVALMRLTGNYPKIVNQEILTNFYKEKRPAMFVANHNSWMDIPFIGITIGWRNYKLVSKVELGKVPILGRAIKVGGHVMLDRSDHRSQLKTLKRGIQTLKDGLFLCAFPEGTRSRNGKLLKFKNGAFKMAYKAGAPIIPISIVGAAKIMPYYWMFPFRPARKYCSVVIHEPVETVGKTEAEVAEQVRKVMISGLPPEQRPDGE